MHARVVRQKAVTVSTTLFNGGVVAALSRLMYGTIRPPRTGIGWSSPTIKSVQRFDAVE